MASEIDRLYHQVEASSGFDRLLPLEAIIDQSQEAGGLREIPDSTEAFGKNPDFILRTKKRLYHLGYIRNLTETPRLSTEDRLAIERFQAEAGITVDGWVGKESWQVLDDLFSFEADSRIAHWTSDKRFLPLLKRAVQLRLFVFSLMKTSPAEKQIDPLTGLRVFVELAGAIGLGGVPLEAGYSFETLHLLFDQDRITQHLAGMTGRINWDRHSRLKAFVVCNAKVELWLLGYSVLPDGKGTYRKPRRRRRSGKGLPRPNRYHGFYKVLRAFCSDVNPDRQHKLTADRFETEFPLFFGEFAQAHGVSEPEPQPNNQELMIQALLRHPQEALQEWGKLRFFAGRLWDGVTRAWGWIKRLMKRVLGPVTSLIRNALRVLWSLAIHSVGILKAAMHSFPAAVAFFLKSDLKASENSAVIFSHDPDFDWRVFVAINPDQDSVRPVLEDLRAQVIRFTFSVRLVGFLMGALMRSIPCFPTGYIAVFLAIARIRPILDPFLDYYQTNKTILLS